MSDRPKGVMVYSSPKNPVAEAAKQHQRQLQEEADRRAAERASRPVPNRICYADLYEHWKANGGGKLPKCKRCRGIIRWEENHLCPGFIPRYRDLDPETHRAMHEAKKENEGDWDDDQYDPTAPGEISYEEDWDDAQYDPTTPGDADWMMHEAETGETRDQVVIEGMTEEEYLMEKFGYIPPCP